MQICPQLLIFCLALGATAIRAAERPLAIDPAQSRVQVVVRASLDSFTGELKVFHPQIAIGSDGQVISARVAFRFADVGTGKTDRDAAMHKWQQTDTHPAGLFVLDKLEPATAPTQGHVAHGQLTFHGVTRNVSFPVTISRVGNLHIIDGDAVVDTREYGLPIIRMLGVLKVDPLVHVRFHLQGQSEG